MMGIPNVTNSRTVMMGVMNKKCPEGYVLVPPDPDYAGWYSKYFCVAKYEMRIESTNKAVSTPIGPPATNITEANAETACANANDGTQGGFSKRFGSVSRFKLISNIQWQIVARNIASVNSNWGASPHSGDAGRQTLNRGYVLPSSSATPIAIPNTSDPCSGTEDSCSTGWSDYKRTHSLSNGEEIWDFSGNAWEWVDGSIDNSIDDNLNSNFISNTQPNPNFISDSTANLLLGPKNIPSQCAGGNDNNSNFPFCGFGKFINDSGPNLIRGGGNFYITDTNKLRSETGIFSAIAKGTSHYDSQWGFRCIYEIEN